MNTSRDEVASTEISEMSNQGVSELVAAGEIAEAVVALDRMTGAEKAETVANLSPQNAAELVEQVVDVSAVEIIDQLPTAVAASILDEIVSDHRVDLIAELSVASAESIIQQMAPAEARDTRHLLQYPSDTAGGLMITEYVNFDSKQSIQDVLNDFSKNTEKYRKYDIQYSYVCDENRLTGVLPLRGVLLSPVQSSVTDIMIENPVSVQGTASLEELSELFDAHHFLGVPVVDSDGVLIGVVQRSSVENALRSQDRSNYLKSQGIVGGEEVRSLPLRDRSRRRLSWLSVNILLNILAASVIAFFQDTLQSVIALAVFLPIISDMSGCSGNQAVAVSMRELSLGLIKPVELYRVFIKETSLGLLTGFSLGTLVAAAAIIWKGDIMLGVVVGAALFANTLIAVTFGGAIPLILKRFNVDPAIASGPLLTTVTDMCGFLLVLGLASLLLV